MIVFKTKPLIRHASLDYSNQTKKPYVVFVYRTPYLSTRLVRDNPARLGSERWTNFGWRLVKRIIYKAQELIC
jgi:hypothetical protein